MTRHLRLAPLAAALLAACGDAAVDPRDPATFVDEADPPFRTDSLAYTMRSDRSGRSATIVATYVNRGDRSVYVVNCSGGTGVVLEKRVGPRWVGVWSPVLLACLSGPIVVRPGATHEFRVNLFDGHRDGNAYPRFSIDDVPGTYRLVWTDVQGRYDDGPDEEAVVPLAARVSNHFMLDVEPR